MVNKVMVQSQQELLMFTPLDVIPTRSNDRMIRLSNGVKKINKVFGK